MYQLHKFPKRKVLRQMGYISDQKGIMNRYLNQEGAWDTHLSNSKRFIERSAILKDKGSVAVLGSGWLLDVSIDFLIQEFEVVYLIDVVHPPQIVHKLRHFPNAHCIEMDLTGGGLQSTYNFLKNYKHFEGILELDKLAGTVVKWDINPDFFISINTLNQLDILLIDKIQEHKLLSKEEEKVLRRIIQENHLRSLPEGKSCIITDFEELVYGKNETLEEQRPLIFTELPSGRFSEQWQWNFDLTRSYYPGKKTLFNVIAIDF